MFKDRTVFMNTIAVIVGLAVTYTVVHFGMIVNAHQLGWDQQVFPEWRYVIKHFSRAPHQIKLQFFSLMLITSGLAALLGGITTAILVKRAKQAYAMFIGFILLLIAFGDIVFTPYHPTWYEVAICPVLFLFSWIGGLLVDLIYKKFFRKEKPSSQSF